MCDFGNVEGHIVFVVWRRWCLSSCVLFVENYTDCINVSYVSQDVMIRISNILDDILVLDSVVRVITKRFWQAGQTPRFLSARASSSLAGSHVAPPPGLLATPPPTHRGHSFSFDSTHTSLHSPRLAAIPPLDRLRMSPSPRARSRKKPVKQASFKDLYQDSAAPGDHINTIFETQEVVLHNACCLIRILVLDHSKV